MNQTLTHVPLSGSRLVRFLSDLNVTNVQVSHKHFAERLGQLIDLSDSVALSAAHSDMQKAVFEPVEVSSQAVIKEYLQVRTTIMQFITASFEYSTDSEASWLTLPIISSNMPMKEGTAYEPFLLFYSTHQREMDFKLKKLRTNARAALSGISPKLSQLATLDTVIDDTLASHVRTLFKGVPKLLKKRFEVLYRNHQKVLFDRQVEDDPLLWTQAGGWLESFAKEMQGLLIAELDVRLQPILGLIEALNEEVESIHE